MMEIYENTNVLDEVELLFKKLEGLPDNAKQSVLSKIQEKVPGQDNNHNDQKSEGKEKCKVTREKALNLNCDDSHDDQGVLTSRGRNTKNLNLHGESSKRSVENQVSLHESACSDEGDSLFIIQYPWMDHQYEAVAPQYISTPIGSSLKTCFERISDNSTHLNVDNTYDQTQVTGDQDEKKGRTKKSEPIPKKVDPSKTPYVCAECRKAFSSSYLLKVHMKNHRGEKDFQCDQCPFRTLTKTNLNQHMIVHKNVKDFMCEYCGKLFLRITGLQNHIQIHLGEKKHPCEECDYKTHSKASLQVHVLAKHNSENSNRHVCPVCGFVVKQQYQLVSHIRVHTGIRPYKRDSPPFSGGHGFTIPDRGFWLFGGGPWLEVTSTKGVKETMVLLHKLECNVCAKTFVTNGILRRHVRHVHSSRQYNCDYCLKDFPTEFHLQRHIRIHFNDKPYNCPYCNYSSSTQGNVSKHVRSIHCKFDFSFRRLNAIKKLASSNGNELQWLEKSETVVKKYLERLSERNGSNLTLESLCEQERKRKSSDNVLLPKNKKHLKKASPVDHSYSEKAVRSDLQNTVQISPVSHDPLLTAHDNQLLSLDSSVAEMELTFHSDIPLQDYVMEMVNDLNPVEVMTAPLDVSLDQETLVVIIGQ